MQSQDKKNYSRHKNIEIHNDWGRTQGYPAFVSTSCICTLADIPPPYPPLDCIWFWMELTEFIPLNRSPDPTWAVCTKLVGSPIMLRSIRRRLLGWGCSAIQQLKHNQNSLMLTVQGINEHQWRFQISLQEAPQSMILNVMNIQSKQKLYFTAFVLGSQVSYI